MKELTIAIALLAAAPWPADAQGAYVSASLTGEMVRLDRIETAAGRDQSNSGETLGFALRVGTELGTRWGVELEFLRPAEIETEFSPGIVPLAFESTRLTFTDLTSPSPVDLVFPSFSYRFRTRQRNTTLSSAVWARQQISSGVSLVYLGGVGFHHRTEEATISFDPSPLPVLPGIPSLPSIPIVLPSSVSTATTYDVGPFAGVEARIGLTTHVQLVPGVRLHGIAGGWLLRPSVGLGWSF